MPYPILSVCVDPNAPPGVKSLSFTSPEAPKPTVMPLVDVNTLLVLAADGAMLACRYTRASDLLHMLRNDTLMPAVLALRERAAWAYLLLDGVLSPTGNGKTAVDGAGTGWDWAATQGALLSMQEAGVGVITLQGARYLADTLYTLAKRDRGAKRLRPPRDMLFVTPAEDVLLALPGIGPERCEDILKHCGGSAAIALDALTDPTCPLPGIGPETKKKIRHELGLSATTRLALTTIDYQEDDHEPYTNGSNSHPTGHPEPTPVAA